MPSSAAHGLALRGWRYAGVMLVVSAAALALVWAYVLAAPMAFLDDEYPRWTAKRTLLDQCDLGEVVVLGDSRAAVAFAPRQTSVPMTNLALAGTSSIDLLTVVNRILRCPDLPKRVILSISPAQLTIPGTFWDKSVRYRLVNMPELLEVLHTSETLNDFQVFAVGDRDGLPPALKVRLHGWRFPSLYFNSLVQNGVFARLGRNRGIFADVLEARGQYFFLGGLAAGSSGIFPEASEASFSVAPIFDAYMVRALGRLAERGIPVDFLGIPFNDPSVQVMRPAYRQGLSAYLRSLEARFPGFRVLGPPVSAWPDTLFNDSLGHFNVAGTQALTRQVSACLDAARGQAGPLAGIWACSNVLNRPQPP